MTETIGRYEVRGQLGEGGMGRVLRGWDPRLRREVALKLVTLERGVAGPVRDKLLARFDREARVLARLHHPGIVGIYELGEHAGLPYLAMELVQGESLHERLERAGPLAPREAVRIGAAVARALEHAHERGVLHRDVKPENVVLASDGTPRLIDFGLAKLASLLSEDKEHALTAPGRTVGTPGYWSPEQVQATDDVGPPTDVWSLGLTLYQALTGVQPFRLPNLVRTIQAICLIDPDLPSRLRPEARAELAGPLEHLLLRCLSKAPARRPTARALAEELERQLANREPPAPLPPPVPPTPAGARSPVEVLGEVMAASLSSESRSWSGELETTRPLDARPIPLPAGSVERATLRAQTLFAQGAAEAAVQAFGEALAVAPGQAELWAMRGVARRRTGDVTGALKDFEAALSFDPREPRALIGRGLLNLERGRASRAVTDLARALELMPPAHPRREDLRAALERARELSDAEGPPL